MKKILIVDDNDNYANNLKTYYSGLGYECNRAIDAAEGWKKFLESKNPSTSESDYDIIITDITMETQTSGLWFIRRVHKDGYKGIKIIATTGFDVPGVMFVSKWILPWFAGIKFMIPKIPLKKGEVKLIPV